MATVTERIRLLFDIDDKAAVGSFGNITKSIKDADGATGKFKAGLGATSDFLKANIATAATAAGTALVAFGVKSVTAFQDTALEAGKLSDALGINVEDASRLMEVSGDLGIDMGTLQGAMQRFNKELGAGKVDLKQFGTDLVYAKDGSIDAYESFINAATAVGAIKDPTDRAREAQRLFGRSYGEIAELMEMDADELRAALADVSEQKVINEDELDKAKDFREAVDNLKDRFENLQLAAGERLVPALTDVANAIGAIDSAVESLGGEGSGGIAGLLSAGWRQSGLSDIIDTVNLLNRSVDDLSEKEALAAGGALWKTVKGNVDEFSTGISAAVSNVARMKTESNNAAREVRSLDEAWGDLKEEIDEDIAFLDLQTTFDDLKTSAQEAWDATSAGAVDAEQKTRDHSKAMLQARADVMTYLEEVLKLPPERSTRILAALDEGDLEYVEAQLAILTRNRTMSISIQAQGGIGYDTGIGPGNRRASGGPVRSGETYLVGENGPEILQMGSTNGNVIPNHRIGGGGAGMTVNIHTSADPQAVVAAIKKYERQNGTGWRA